MSGQYVLLLCVPLFTILNEVWGMAHVKHMNISRTLQERALRTIAKVDKYHHSDILFKEFSILKLHRINDFLISQIMYKAFYYDLPKSVQSIFIRTGDIHQYGTRRKHDFHLQRPKSNLYKKTVGFKGI